jgi:3-oxoacyl-[acyl-carrier-protein] synthase-3
VGVSLLATGSYLPQREVRNSGLSQFPPAVLGVIEEKTGICARRYAAEGESTSDLAVKAARAALSKADIAPREIDAVIVATSSPDRMQPATATRVQYLLAASSAFAFDINSVCSGAVYGMAVATGLLCSTAARTVLVIASEVYSRILNPKDFSTAPYFGDGAGALLLRSGEQNQFLSSVLRTDGSGSDTIQVPAGGSMRPFGQMADARDQFFTMKGKEVFAFAVEKGAEVILEAVRAAGLKVQSISWVVAHQANINILRELAVRTGISFEKFYTNLHKYGNTAGASVLIALDELITSGAAQSGDSVVICAFGGGLSWGATVVRL